MASAPISDERVLPRVGRGGEHLQLGDEAARERHPRLREQEEGRAGRRARVGGRQAAVARRASGRRRPCARSRVTTANAPTTMNVYTKQVEERRFPALRAVAACTPMST